jgi:hypothetical protein
MSLHDKGIMVLILSMARERAQGGHMFMIDVSTGSFATILMLSAGSSGDLAPKRCGAGSANDAL